MARDVLYILPRLFAYFVAANSEPFLSAGAITRSHRKLSANHPDKCRAIAMRILPSPALKNYDQCFTNLIAKDTTHDWSIPGAEVAAQIECWCKHNLTDTIKAYGCCDHADVRPMCETVCQPDCSSSLAAACIQDCPSMCFESAEYILDDNLCKSCNWARCWPVVRCLTVHARQRVENNSLARTCHNIDLQHGEELRQYWKCWKNTPKHTSHWNILSSLVHCICREGMIKLTRDTHCCDSVLNGWGVCSLECKSEATCSTQEAQTCIHGCQRKCPAYDVVPSDLCLQDCLKDDSPCKKYVSCRPPSVATHVCDDGRWPQAASGCCTSNETSWLLGCPKLCETQRVWRLDRTRGVPWWARFHNSNDGIIAQCTCMGCPESDGARFEKLKQTVTESIWENGQSMLVDIARREQLILGPNRKMQELMAKRNGEIMYALDQFGSGGDADAQIATINDKYGVLITEAARLGDDPWRKRTGRDKPSREKNRSGGMSEKMMFAMIVGVSAASVVCTIMCASLFLARVWKKTRQSRPVAPVEQGSQIVIGNPVPRGAAADAADAPEGAPITVAAPIKAKSTSLS